MLTPRGHDAARLLDVALDRFDVALGVGLGKLAGKVFRIGHLGDFNDLGLLGTLAGVEMGLALAGVPHRPGGVGARASGVRPDRTSSTICRRNSAGYGGLDFGIADTSSQQDQVSTKPGQLHCRCKPLILKGSILKLLTWARIRAWVGRKDRVCRKRRLPSASRPAADLPGS